MLLQLQLHSLGGGSVRRRPSVPYGANFSLTVSVFSFTFVYLYFCKRHRWLEFWLNFIIPCGFPPLTLMSVGVVAHHRGFLDVRHCCGGLRISWWIGQRFMAVLRLLCLAMGAKLSFLSTLLYSSLSFFPSTDDL